jgi:acyl-CoA thioester hydrolase
VLIRSVVTVASPATCRAVQRALRGGELLCEAQLRMAFVAPNGRPRRQPASWLAAMAPIVSPHFPDESCVLA